MRIPTYWCCISISLKDISQTHTLACSFVYLSVVLQTLRAQVSGVLRCVGHRSSSLYLLQWTKMSKKIWCYVFFASQYVSNEVRAYLLHWRKINVPCEGQHFVYFGFGGALQCYFSYINGTHIIFFHITFINYKPGIYINHLDSQFLFISGRLVNDFDSDMSVWCLENSAWISCIFIRKIKIVNLIN